MATQLSKFKRSKKKAPRKKPAFKFTNKDMDKLARVQILLFRALLKKRIKDEDKLLDWYERTIVTLIEEFGYCFNMSYLKTDYYGFILDEDKPFISSEGRVIIALGLNTNTRKIFAFSSRRSYNIRRYWKKLDMIKFIDRILREMFPDDIKDDMILSDLKNDDDEEDKNER